MLLYRLCIPVISQNIPQELWIPKEILPDSNSAALDQIDYELVRLLQQNARLSNKELAARVSLAESSTLTRVRRLEVRGVLRGYHAEVALASLGIHLQALIAVRLTRHSREIVERFRQHCQSLPPVIAAFNIGGTDDFLVHVGVRDAEALRELLLTSISTRSEVAHVETHIVFDVVRGPASSG